MIKSLLIWLIISIITSIIVGKFISAGKGGDVNMAKSAKEGKKGSKGTKSSGGKKGSGGKGC